jgi:hypothetical protein
MQALLVAGARAASASLRSGFHSAGKTVPAFNDEVIREK